MLVLLLSSVFFPLAAQQGSKQVNNLRLWHSPDSTRIVFDISANVQHKMFTLDKPLRLVVDIENAALNFNLPILDQANRHISAIRSGRSDNNRLRFVFELKKPLLSDNFLLSPNELYGHRLVVDLSEQSQKAQADRENVAAVTSAQRSEVVTQDSTGTAKPAAKRVAVVTTRPRTEAANRARLLVAIDAGHGGEDPGALGYRGSREKKLTLAIAKKLASVIDQDPLMQSYMVRTGDYYINLHKRRQMAREAGADLFISIHADAFKMRSASGFSVFALSQSGATSAMAGALAAKENASDLIGGVSLSDKDEVVAKVLVDLSMTNTIRESVNFGGRILKKLGSVGKLHSKRVEQAGFAVLKSADIPSVLIETGFVTNPNEEKNLNSSNYQSKVAHAIHSAIKEYYQQTPYRSNATYAAPIAPPSQSQRTASTYTSLVKPNGASNNKPSKKVATKNYHTVVRGDSLSKIALMYGTNVSQLKRLNNIKRSTVILGQRLKVGDSSSSNLASSSKPSNRPSAKPVYYKIRSGDSLSKVSQRFNVTIRALKKLNNLRKDTVFIGQRLKIPGGVAQSAVAESKAVTHTVRRGDTLSEIAEKYGSSVLKIKSFNALRSSTVMLGQKLKIPRRLSENE